MKRVAVIAGALAAIGTLAGSAALAYFNASKDSPQPVSVAPPATIRYESNASGDAQGFLADRVTVNKPAGVQLGWLMVAFVGTQDVPAVTPPSGWTGFGGTVASSPSVEQVSQRAFYRIAGASEPRDYTFRFDRTKNATAGISAYSGVRARNPIDASANASGHTGTFGTPRAPAPQANARYATQRIVASTWAETSLFGNPLTFNGVTEQWDRQTATTAGGAGGSAQPAGPTGSASVEGFPNTDWVIQTVVINASP